MPITATDVANYVTTRLSGGGLIDIEVGPTSIPNALDQTLRRYSVYKPKFSAAQIITQPGVQVYTVDTGGNPVVRVFPRSTAPLPGLINDFDVFKYPIYEVLAGRGYNQFASVGEIELYNQWLTAIAKTLSAEFEWEYDESSKKLFISPSPAGSVPMSVVYSDKKKIEEISSIDQDWVLEYTLCLIKQDMGLVRRKFNSIPGSTMVMELDGKELVMEGRERQQELEAELLSRAVPPEFLIG